VGYSGHQCSHAPGRPILHRRLILSQTLAGRLSYIIDSSSFWVVPLFVSGGRSFVPACACRRAARRGAVKGGRRAALRLASMQPGHALYGPEHGARITLDGMPSHRS
jgi:hypothetical protein